MTASNYDHKGSVDSRGNATSFEPENAVDGNATTAWRLPGDGEGEWLQLDFGRTVQLEKVGLIPGYAKVDPYDATDRFRQNYVIDSTRLEFSDGTAVLCSFEYTETVQFCNVGDVISTYVRIMILSTYPPRSDDPRYFTPISEVQVFGWER